MADGIFFCRLHFCESAVAAFRQKHFVVSESTFSMTLCGNCSLYFSLKFNAFTAFNKCYHRAETRCAVGLSSQFTEQLVYVALRIAVLACITCGVDLIGHCVIVVTNLKPVKLCGVESKGMLLAASDGNDNLQVAFVDGMAPGSRVR